MLGRQVKLVSCHLGGSSSMCAIDRRPLDRYHHGFLAAIGPGERHPPRRSGRLRGALHDGAPRLELAEVRRQLASGGGLAGLSGIAGGDVRDLEAAAAAGSRARRWRCRVFVYQVKKTIGAYAAAMGGLEAVAFTGGIGENSARLRAACCDGLGFLGIELDAGEKRARRRRPRCLGRRFPVAVLALAHQRRTGRRQAGLPPIGVGGSLNLPD